MAEHKSIAEHIATAIRNGHSVEEIEALLTLFNESFPELISIIYAGDKLWKKHFGYHPLSKEPLDTLYDEWIDRALEATSNIDV